MEGGFWGNFGKNIRNEKGRIRETMSFALSSSQNFPLLSKALPEFPPPFKEGRGGPDLSFY
jgi:hypothetical protein